MKMTRREIREYRRNRRIYEQEYALFNALATPATKRSFLDPAPPPEPVTADDNQSEDILPPELPYFKPLRGGIVLVCPSCTKPRPRNKFTPVEGAPDLLTCPCGTVGYTLVAQATPEAGNNVPAPIPHHAASKCS